MSLLLAANLVLLAQGYDDAGATSRLSIIIGALAFPCLVIIAVIWQKLKNAKESEKDIEKLQKRVAELEQEKNQDQEWENMVEELEQATNIKQPIGEKPTFGKTTQPFTIVHIDDEEWLLKMAGLVIRRNEAFKNVIIKTFQNRDEAWEELLHTDPDLLITDLRSDNVPGQTKYYGMNGFELLSLLAQRDVKYPVLVFSGSLAMEGIEHRARQYAGQKMNVSFLQKPATPEQLCSEIRKALLSAAGSDKPAA